MTALRMTNPRALAALLAAAALALVAPAAAQIRVSQPLPTGQSSSSGISPDSGAGPATPPPTTYSPKGGPLAPASAAERAGGAGTTAGTTPEATPETSGTTAEDSGAEGGGDEEELTHGGYDPQGRRDPFRPLTGEAADTELRKAFEGKLQGLLLSEVKLTSIVKTSKGNIATFEGGPKKVGYFAHVGDKFWDGQVIEINYDTHTVVIRQQLNDPRLIKPFRDQVIPLYGEDEKVGGGQPGGSD